MLPKGKFENAPTSPKQSQSQKSSYISMALDCVFFYKALSYNLETRSENKIYWSQALKQTL